MRWIKKEQPKHDPKEDPRRIVSRFLWLPFTLPITEEGVQEQPKETRWLERAVWVEEYQPYVVGIDGSETWVALFWVKEPFNAADYSRDKYGVLHWARGEE